jgi:hypothetical protein
MNRSNENNEANKGLRRSTLDILMTLIFKNVYPVWEQYCGDVPAEELKRLDEMNDWPSGVAAAVIERLNRGKKIRAQARYLCD